MRLRTAGMGPTGSGSCEGDDEVEDVNYHFSLLIYHHYYHDDDDDDDDDYYYY